MKKWSELKHKLALFKLEVMADDLASPHTETRKVALLNAIETTLDELQFQIDTLKSFEEMD